MRILLSSALALSVNLLFGAQTVITIPATVAGSADATDAVRIALETAPRENVRIVFPCGTYRFSVGKAFGKYHSITNHENGYKYIAFNIDGFTNVEIDGNGSEFIFTGTMLPVLIENSTNVRVHNMSIDWETPFFVQGEVIGVGAGGEYYDLRMSVDGYSWGVSGERLRFPENQNFTYECVGESLVFDKNTHAPIYGASDFDIHRRDDVQVVELGNNILRIYEPRRLKTLPPVGSIVIFKGPMGANRYAPAIHCIASKGVEVENVNIYHALGMGFLGEKTEDITLSRFNVCLREGVDRMVSATADATHFCNCKGDILVEKCTFENMLDDGTNVHGTYLKVGTIVDKHTVRAELHHFQQRGFVFGQRGDKVWFLVAPCSDRGYENEIVALSQINESVCTIKFREELPPNLRPGDLIENKTWNSDSFVLRDCRILNHRARNIVIKTPNRVLIENNFLQSMMASILLRGESSHWYESGATTDVTIRGNHFDNCVLGGGEQAVLFISPRMSPAFAKKQQFDSNIRFENNTITTFDNMIVDATNVEGLTIRNNKVVQNGDYQPFNAGKHLYNLVNCKDAVIEGNQYVGSHTLILKTDGATTKKSGIK